MKVKIRRFIDGNYKLSEYELHISGNPTVLEVLTKIKEEIDPTLSFRAMCRASVCGTCAVKVNGEHRLACSTRVKEGEVLIEPVEGSEPIKDLVVSHEDLFLRLSQAKVWLEPMGENQLLTPSELVKTSRPWDCILCGICNNVCPPLIEGKSFGGPALFTKLYKTLADPRDRLGEERLPQIVSFNVQECVHCSNCTLFCPKGCMPEKWVSATEMKLISRGLIQKKGEDFGFLGF